MEKKLITVFIFFIVFLIFFISIIFISENRNIQDIKQNYSNVSMKAILYKKVRLKIWALNLILTFAIPFIFLISRFSSKIANFSFNKGKKIVFAIIIYVFIYTVLDFLFNLPLNFYSGFIVRHNFGVSNQTLSRWINLVFKSFLLNLIVSVAFLWVPFYIIYKYPNRWWLYLGLLSIPIYLFISFISPMYIDPLFNEYSSIEDKNLEKDIVKLLNKAGIKDAQIYQVNKSQDTKEMNAYMTGVFNSKRIVLWDTTIENLDKEEILCVTAHEMGHYVKGHIWKNIFIQGLFTIFILFLIDKTSIWILKLSGGSFGFKNFHDIACLPLILLVLNFYIFLFSPIMNSYSRHLEWQADKFALDLTRDNKHVASSLLKLHEGNLGIPKSSNIYRIWYRDHPSCEARVNFALNYKCKRKKY